MKKRAPAKKKTAKRANGRPPFEPTDEQRAMVQAMVICGVPEDQIAETFALFPGRVGKPLDPKTLRKYFRKELDGAIIFANARVVASLFKMAVGANGVPAQAGPAIFWTKTHLGWRERVNVQVSGDAKNPVRVIDPVALSKLPIEDLLALESVYARLGIENSETGQDTK